MPNLYLKLFKFRVYLARHAETGDSVALKTVKNYGEADPSRLEITQNEINVMGDLDHVNIIKMFDSSLDSSIVLADGREVPVFYLALELAGGGELFDFIAETGRFDEDTARYYFHQLIEGLEHMHTRGYSHKDLKPDNILLDSNFTLKIGDLGYASSNTSDDKKIGTEQYMAPEVVKRETYSNKAADLFA